MSGERKTPNGTTAPPDPLAFPQVANQFTTTISSGIRSISGISLGKINGTALNISGNVIIGGSIISPIIAAGGLSLPRGSLATPSINFIEDPFVGIFSPASGQISLCADGLASLVVSSTAVQVAAPITTPSGNLILNPAGGAVDFSGKAIINFSGFATNPNYYDITAPNNIDTIGATTGVILTLATVPGAVYTLEAYVSCLSITDGTSAASFIQSAKAKNIGGVLTISTAMEINSSRDPALTLGAAVAFVVNGTSIDLTAIGVAGQQIRWWGAVKIQRMLS